MIEPRVVDVDRVGQVTPEPVIRFGTSNFPQNVLAELAALCELRPEWGRPGKLF
jgi:hypothetical protein